MYKPFLHILFCLLASALRAQQNLVPNGSFEEITRCPLYFGDSVAEHWYSVTAASSPDLYHTCAVQVDQTQIVPEVPENYNGWQWPRTGDAYMGIGHNVNLGTEGGEYIQCDLTEHLLAGSRYIVEFFVSRADYSDRAPNILGAFLSQDTVFSSVFGLLPFLPQATNIQNQPLIDAVNWIRIVDTITAQGGEQHLTIGVFSNNTGWTLTDGLYSETAVVFIDDVSVVKDSQYVEIPNVFTPNGDGINDLLQINTSGFSDGELNLYDRWGRRVFSVSGTAFSWNGQSTTGNCHDGVYYVIVSMIQSNGKRITKKDFVHLLR